MIRLTVNMNIENVSPLVARRIWKLHVRLCEVGIITGDAQGLGKLVLHPRAPEGLRRDAAVIIEYRVVPNLHRQAVKGDESPGPVLVIRPAGIVGLPDVGTVANSHKALQVERKLLAADPQLQRSASERLGQSNPSLLDIEPVPIDRRQHGLPWRIVGLKLDERLDLIRNAKVGIELVSADDVILAAIRTGTEVRSVVGLEPLTCGRAEREIGVAIGVGQRNVFELVERLTRDARVREHRPVLLPSVEHDGWPLRRGGLRALIVRPGRLRRRNQRKYGRRRASPSHLQKQF